MRYYQVPIGAQRTRRKFLLFPKYVNGETRWLETACWTENRVSGYLESPYWESLKWISEQAHEELKEEYGDWWYCMPTFKTVGREEYIAREYGT